VVIHQLLERGDGGADRGEGVDVVAHVARAGTRAQGCGRAPAGRSGMTVAIASLGACRVAGLSSGRCCALSSRLRRRRWWFVAAATPLTSCAFMLSGRRGPGRWTDSRCRVSRSSRFSACRWKSCFDARFASFRTIYLPTAGDLGKHGFELLATAQRPHFTVRLERADDRELGSLLAALGPARPNPQYARTDVWREEG
jgi:hypothetical protein